MCGASRDGDAGEHVEAREALRRVDLGQGDELRDRGHVVPDAHEDVVQRRFVHTVFGVRLDDDVVEFGEAVELGGERTAVIALQHGKDFPGGDAGALAFRGIEIHAVLREVGVERGAGRTDLRPFPQVVQESGGDLVEVADVAALGVLYEELESVGGAVAGDHRHRGGEDGGFIDVVGLLLDAGHDGVHAVLPAGAQAPVLEPEGEGAVRAALAGDDAEAGGIVVVADFGNLADNFVFDAVHHALGEGEGGAGRGGDVDADDAHVFLGNEAALGRAHGPEEGAGAEEDQYGDDPAVAQEAAGAFDVFAAQGAESGVEGCAEPLPERQRLGFDVGGRGPGVTVTCPSFRFQQQSAEGGTQSQGVEGGDADGDGHGEAELRIEGAGGAADHRDRQEHRHEHQGTRNQCRRHVVHRIHRRLPARLIAQVQLGMHRLHHDDRVIHHDADRQDQCEERQQVDAESHQVEEEEGADERNQRADQRNQGRTGRTQEDEDHQDHQQDGLQQRAHHLLDGRVEEVVGVGHHGVGQVRGEFLRGLLHIFVDLLDNLRGVGTRRLVDGEIGARRVVDLSDELVRLGAQLDARDIPQTQDFAVRQSLDHDVLELLWLLEPPLVAQGVFEGHVGVLAQRTGRRFDVLLRQGGGNVGRHQLVLRHDVRLEPDAHAVVAAAHVDVTHARDAGDRRNEVDLDVVGDEDAVVGAVRAVEGDLLEDVGLALADGDADFVDLGGQLARGAGDAVLDVDRRHVRVGTLLEIDADGGAAAVGRGRLHVGHVLDAVDGFLQGHDDAALHGLGVGAGIVRHHHDGRGRDVGIALDGKGQQSDDPADDQEDGNDRREDGAVDEGLYVHCSAALMTFLMLTGAPSRSRPTPAATMVSPGASPPWTTYSLPLLRGKMSMILDFASPFTIWKT